MRRREQSRLRKDGEEQQRPALVLLAVGLFVGCIFLSQAGKAQRGESHSASAILLVTIGCFAFGMHLFNKGGRKIRESESDAGAMGREEEAEMKTHESEGHHGEWKDCVRCEQRWPDASETL